ncbi:hypothetical protein PsAD14_00536 [Pseudovibrio sp. Ad14]|nr:hypothetical protein PsAD14_00536 [Pseudovibrio sp. Ad14]
MTPQTLMNKVASDGGMEAPVFNTDGECTLNADDIEIHMRACDKRLKMMAYLSEDADVPQHVMVQMLHENHTAKNRFTFIRVALGQPAVVSCIALEELDATELKLFLAEFKEVVRAWKPKFTPASQRQCERKMKRDGICHSQDSAKAKLELH